MSPFAAFALGALAGAALGLLLAPEPGARTRGRMRSWLKERHLTGPHLASRLRRAFSPRGRKLVHDGFTSRRNHRRGI